MYINVYIYTHGTMYLYIYKYTCAKNRCHSEGPDCELLEGCDVPDNFSNGSNYAQSPDNYTHVLRETTCKLFYLLLLTAARKENISFV